MFTASCSRMNYPSIKLILFLNGFLSDYFEITSCEYTKTIIHLWRIIVKYYQWALASFVHDYILPIYLYLTVDILFNMAHKSVSSSLVCFNIFRQFEHTPKQSIEQLIISHPANSLLNNRALSVRSLDSTFQRARDKIIRSIIFV